MTGWMGDYSRLLTSNATRKKKQNTENPFPREGWEWLNGLQLAHKQAVSVHGVTCQSPENRENLFEFSVHQEKYFNGLWLLTESTLCSAVLYTSAAYSIFYSLGESMKLFPRERWVWDLSLWCHLIFSVRQILYLRAFLLKTDSYCS